MPNYIEKSEKGSLQYVLSFPLQRQPTFGIYLYSLFFTFTVIHICAFLKKNINGIILQFILFTWHYILDNFLSVWVSLHYFGQIHSILEYYNNLKCKVHEGRNPVLHSVTFLVSRTVHNNCCENACLYLPKYT